ncbi:MAG: 4-hydroxybutyrate dehydrogenase [Acetobacterium sp. MES1]|uniref:4-hydroxybutyrate dehydrogenase n=1 Tax=Acetobacterium sp. MES1 TaxID=1899015 RepID=UPI000B9D0883|nr:4-hydroxybutyrate dehydrogenase [Acetobacterium sp. MES1]OXS25708.1 MAG: 4-hydroxybutyrate dehydrogenase [Acetobacterium sp. MES1]
MKQFKITPQILEFDHCTEVGKHFGIGAGDLVFISDRTYAQHFSGAISDEAYRVNYRSYVTGEPTDVMVEAIYADIKDYQYQRVFAIGGGTILDVAKLFALKNTVPVVDLFNKELEISKDKELILIPTTCGTGSEVTNISILELTAINSKFGLAVDELYADYAVLVPELLSDLPMNVFATSSIDAFIHAIESYTSPKASAFSQLYSKKAMEMIISGYQTIAEKGPQARTPLLGEMMIASTFAGIAFGNAGCAAVHAMSYPLGAVYHVPHGEANYAIFTAVYKTYQALAPDGSIAELNAFLAKQLGCDKTVVYQALETLLDHILPKKALRDYGVTQTDLEHFTEAVMTKQTRLMANNYVPLNEDQVRAIYQQLY